MSSCATSRAGLLRGQLRPSARVSRSFSSSVNGGLRFANPPYGLEPAQADLFSEDIPTPEYRADPDSVRAELYKILAEARAAQKLPWEPKRVLLYRTIFPQMTNWLPDEEGAQLRFEFEAEIKRLEAA